MKISIIGAGYVGLVTGACLADKNHQVIVVDIDPDKVDKINQAIAPIYEVGLPELLERNVPDLLHATRDLRQAVLSTDLTIIAVGTPFNGQEINLSYIREASQQIGSALREKSGYHLVVVKSTVVPGTTDQVVLPILEAASGKRAGMDFGIGMNPEFLTEGVAIQDFMHPDRIVLGGIDTKSIQWMKEIYTGFDNVPQILTNNKTAEMIKYASNALLATMISFSNELGNLCSALGGMDIVDVMDGVHKSNYLSPLQLDGKRIEAAITSFLEAGCGFGGSCLPKDVKALVAHGEKAGARMALLNSVIQINERQHQQMIYRLKKHFPTLEGIRVAVLGLAFKPDTDDMRESPAIPIINDLLQQKAIVKAYDPVTNREAEKRFGRAVTFCGSLESAIEDAQAILLVTRWKEFLRLPEIIRSRQPSPLLIDGRRVLDKTQFHFYEGIGL